MPGMTEAKVLTNEYQTIPVIESKIIPEVTAVVVDSTSDRKEDVSNNNCCFLAKLAISIALLVVVASSCHASNENGWNNFGTKNIVQGNERDYYAGIGHNHFNTSGREWYGKETNDLKPFVQPPPLPQDEPPIKDKKQKSHGRHHGSLKHGKKKRR